MRSLIPSLIVLLAATVPARSDEAAIRAGQDTVRAQIEAFLADDAPAAYSFAAPNIKRIFPTEDAFMRMVISGYPQVHRPRSYAFGRVEMTGAASLIQRVLIVAEDGREYEAVYTLELQEDGSYRITGVHLREASTIGA